MFDESIKASATSDNGRLAPSLNNIGIRTRIKCDGQCLKQHKIIFTHLKVVTHLKLSLR